MDLLQSGNKDEISRGTVVSILCGYFFTVIQESVVRNKLDIYFIFIINIHCNLILETALANTLPWTR